METLGKRLERFGLSLQPEKTRLIDFRRPLKSKEKGKGSSTFDFLGFTHYWQRGRKGSWHVAWKTRTSRVSRAINAIHDWCRQHRHEAVSTQHQGLKTRIQGHMNYFGVNGNLRCIRMVVDRARFDWHKWLNRRSEKSRLKWERFKDLLHDFPLPEPRLMVNLWAT